MLKWLWLSAAVLGFDQLSKFMVNSSMVEHESMDFIPLLDITLMFNKGAAFSFLSTVGPWARWSFTVVALVVSVVIVKWLRRLTPAEKVEALGLSLILGGALGNVIDRLFLGYVIDFLDFNYQAESCLPLFYSVHNMVTECHWPAFNIADAAISIGVAVLIIDTVRNAFIQKSPSTDSQN